MITLFSQNPDSGVELIEKSLLWYPRLPSLRYHGLVFMSLQPQGFFVLVSLCVLDRPLCSDFWRCIQCPFRHSSLAPHLRCNCRWYSVVFIFPSTQVMTRADFFSAKQYVAFSISLWQRPLPFQTPNDLLGTGLLVKRLQCGGEIGW